MINGVTNLIMMKSDVLDSFDVIKAAVGYEVDGQRTDEVPFDTYADITPIYKEFKGWKTPIAEARSESELPEEFKAYIKFIEDYLGVPVTILSVGPDRDQTIFR